MDAKITNVGNAANAQTISEEEFFARLAKSNPEYPRSGRTFLGRCKAVGCDPQLRRGYLLYVEDPNGERMNLGAIRREGTVDIWGMAVRDRLLPEPVGLEYMRQVASFLPNAYVKDDLPNPLNWHVKYGDRSSIPLALMLQHQEEWLAAIQRALDRFHVIETTRSDGSAREAIHSQTPSSK
jgi:hypothetical protein